MNTLLCGEFTRQEVVIALKQMSPFQAPKPDGLPPIFFQHYWDTIGDDVTQAVLSCLNTGQIPTGINHTYINLNPKFKCPNKVTEF